MMLSCYYPSSQIFLIRFEMKPVEPRQSSPIIVKKKVPTVAKLKNPRVRLVTFSRKNYL